jgi:hypothetical protein
VYHEAIARSSGRVFRAALESPRKAVTVVVWELKRGTTHAMHWQLPSRVATFHHAAALARALKRLLMLSRSPLTEQCNTRQDHRYCFLRLRAPLSCHMQNSCRYFTAPSPKTPRLEGSSSASPSGKLHFASDLFCVSFNVSPRAVSLLRSTSTTA